MIGFGGAGSRTGGREGMQRRRTAATHHAACKVVNKEDKFIVSQ
jgi:hypothetical protein